MIWFLIVVLTLVAVLAFLAVLAVTGFMAAGIGDERTRIDMEVRRAERHLHDIARDSFQAMLDAARPHEPRR